VSYGQYSDAPKVTPPAKPAKETKLKVVFDTREVSHVFAHPLLEDGSGFAQSHARNPQNNLFFNTSADGLRILYSYRESYPIASRFVVGKGKHAKAVFLVRSGKPYSVTTAQHMSQASNAVRNLGEVFHVPYVCRYDNLELSPEYPRSETLDKTTHSANLADYVSRIAEEVRKYGAARSAWAIEHAHADAVTLTNEAKQYAKVFGLKLPKLPKLPAFDPARVEAAKARQAHLDATRDEREAKRNAEALKRAQEDIDGWKRGELNATYTFSRLTPYALLRVVRNPEDNAKFVCETSQGIRVPISGPTGAARLLRVLESLKASSHTYHTNGHSEHVGAFTVTNFDGEILVAGCHKIQWQTIAEIASDVRKAEETETLNGIAFA
jgi:hypothetical protein